MKPLVSIIIPCYNYGRYLAEAIESALSQSYALLEIIVINDGSTDDSKEVASRYPVILINQKNQGAAKTFNRGIESAKGKYLVIVSADDKLHPSYVEKTVAVLENDPLVSFVYTHTVIFGARNGLMKSKAYNVDSLKLANYITGTALMRKEVFTVVSGFDPALKCLEDWDMWLTFAENGFYGRLLPEPLFFYRIHEVSSRNIVTFGTLFDTTLKNGRLLPEPLFFYRIHEVSSRNIVTFGTLFDTTLKIWRRHKKICPISFILRSLLISGLYIFIRSLLIPVEFLLPPPLKQKVNKFRLGFVYRKGVDIV